MKASIEYPEEQELVTYWPETLKTIAMVVVISSLAFIFLLAVTG